MLPIDHVWYAFPRTAWERIKVFQSFLTEKPRWAKGIFNYGLTLFVNSSPQRKFSFLRALDFCFKIGVYCLLAIRVRFRAKAFLHR